MEYIYCKDSEEYEYTMRTLERMGYETKLKDFPIASEIDKRGITIFISNEFKLINFRWTYGYYPCGRKSSIETNHVSFNKFTKLVKENLKKTERILATINNKTEPLDDTEELEQDREKLRKFAKDTKGKAKITLAPMQILKDVAEVREYGVKKYGSVDSWKEVPIEDYRDALFRHLLEYIKDPNSVDKESGIKHYKHIACNLAFICEMESKDDDPTSI